VAARRINHFPHNEPGQQAAGTLGESSAIQPGFFHFDTMKSALVNDAKSASDLTSVGYMPASDPTGGATYKLSRAESRALGLMAGDGAGLDGSVGFNSGEAYTFDPNHRALPGKVDFIGVAEHEISEVMGRFGSIPRPTRRPSSGSAIRRAPTSRQTRTPSGRRVEPAPMSWAASMCARTA
jgi:hypothetical protein